MKTLQQIIVDYHHHNDKDFVNEIERMEANLALRAGASTTSRKVADHFRALGFDVTEETDTDYANDFYVEIPSYLLED